MADRHRILLVDDDPHGRDALARLLELEGYEVDTACDGTEAWAKYLSATPDLVVTDFRMPGLSGAELLRRIARDGRSPVIVVSAYEPMRARLQGVAEYFSKPLDLGALLAAAERTLQGRRGACARQ